jgi:hypothetical protein
MRTSPLGPKAAVQNAAFDGRLAPMSDARDRCSSSRKRTPRRSALSTDMGGFATVRSATARPKTGHSSFGSIWPRAAYLLWGAHCEKADADDAVIIRRAVLCTLPPNRFYTTKTHCGHAYVLAVGSIPGENTPLQPFSRCSTRFHAGAWLRRDQRPLRGGRVWISAVPGKAAARRRRRPGRRRWRAQWR